MQLMVQRAQQRYTNQAAAGGSLQLTASRDLLSCSHLAGGSLWTQRQPQQRRRRSTPGAMASLQQSRAAAPVAAMARPAFTARPTAAKAPRAAARPARVQTPVRAQAAGELMAGRRRPHWRLGATDRRCPARGGPQPGAGPLASAPPGLPPLTAPPESAPRPPPPRAATASPSTNGSKPTSVQSAAKPMDIVSERAAGAGPRVVPPAPRAVQPRRGVLMQPRRGGALTAPKP